MEPKDLKQEFQDQFNDVVSRLQSQQFFQSDWDIASFAVFFIFIGESGEDALTISHISVRVCVHEPPFYVLKAGAK